MSIATNIDGSVGLQEGQLFDLLSVLADPQSYNKRLKALQDATAENKKLIDLVGPAKEVLELREKAKQEFLAAKEEAKNIKDEAEQKASLLITKAEETLSDADKRASEMQAAAAQELNEAKAKNQELSEKLKSAQSELERLRQLQKEAEAAKANAAASVQISEKSIQEAYEYRNMIVAKHRAFIESIA